MNENLDNNFIFRKVLTIENQNDSSVLPIKLQHHTLLEII